jgi:pimeloyl-ACP methyl ester carboxylesterase
MAGFPDNETSGWGTVVPEALGKKYRCIFMCLPDYGTNQDPLRFKPWGYEQEEVLTMMGNTLQSLGLRSNPYLMVAHDWGAFYALLYTTRNPSEVSKLILCDVGMVDPFALPVQTIPYIIFYQVYFAVVYVISQVLSLSLATTMFWALKRYFQFLMPTPNDRFHLPESEIRVQKCYPYYYLWRRLLTGSMLKVKFPACPLLFLVSFCSLGCVCKLRGLYT